MKAAVVCAALLVVMLSYTAYASYGVDFSAGVSTRQMVCLKHAGYSYAISRVRLAPFLPFILLCSLRFP